MVFMLIIIEKRRPKTKMSTTTAESVHHSPEEFRRIDDELSSRLGQIEALISISELDEREKKAVLYELDRDFNQVIDGDGAVDPFGIVRDVWNRTAGITRNSQWDEGRFTAKHMAAIKLYTAGLFHELAQREESGQSVDGNRVYEAYFASSDLPTEYVGGYDSSLELFALSRRSEAGRQQTRNLVAGLVYDGTFSDITPSLQKAWSSQKSVEGRLNMLGTIDYLLRQAENELYPTDSMQAAIRAMEELVANADEAPVFVARVAGAMLQETEARTHTEWVYLDELPTDEAQRLLALDRARREQRAEEQRILHEAFPGFAEEALLYRIATDACVEVSRGELGQLMTTGGDTINLHRPDTASAKRFSLQDIDLLKQAHQADILETIELESGIDMRLLPLNVQVKFFRFMAEADRPSYDRLTRLLHGRTKEQRESLAEAFLAIEFGDDLGDIILEIAEKDVTSEAASSIFSNISEIRTLLNSWGEETWFGQKGTGFEAYFKGIKRSIEERISELLSPLPNLLGNQAVVASFYKGQKLDATAEVVSTEEIIQDLSALRLAIGKIAESEKGSYGDNTIRQGDGVARFESVRESVAVSTRPEASAQGEARVAWAVKISPDEQEQIYGQVLEYTAKGKPKSGNLTIRVDLEDATHKLSLDIGSSDPAQKINYRLATAVSAGAQHLAARRGEDIVGRDYHVRTHFDAELARPDRFKEWALWMRHNVEIWKNRRSGKRLLDIITARPVA